MTMAKVKLEPRSCARPSHASNAVSESSKIQNTSLLALHYTIPIAIRAPVRPLPLPDRRTVASFHSPTRLSPQVVLSLPLFFLLSSLSRLPYITCCRLDSGTLSSSYLIVIPIWRQNVPSPSPTPFLSETVYYEEPQSSHLPISVEFGTLL